MTRHCMDKCSHNKILHNKMSLRWNGQQNVRTTNEYSYIYTCTLRNDLATQLPNYFQFNLYYQEAFLLLNQKLLAHLNAKKKKCFSFFLGHCRWVAPFISVSHTPLNVAKQVILASLSQESQFNHLLCVPHLSHLLPSWNSKFSVKASANYDKKESSQEK